MSTKIPHHQHYAYDVIRRRRVVDTRRSLIGHDGYPDDITVRERPQRRG